jgi:hypothetical protein
MRFVQRYDWSIEYVSGEGRQRGMTGSRTVSFVESSLEMGNEGRFVQCVARMRWCVGNVTLRFCVAKEAP